MKPALIILIVASISGIFLSFTSCSDQLDIQQACDFNLSTMPVQKRIKQGETAEIRLKLHKSGNYKQAEFFISYFQPDGRGSLKMDDGTVFLPNDIYPLTKETFRLYYTSECEDQQTIDLLVVDSFGQKYDLAISFSNDSDKEEDAKPNL